MVFGVLFITFQKLLLWCFMHFNHFRKNYFYGVCQLLITLTKNYFYGVVTFNSFSYDFYP
ncbi:hypothetical protein BWI92_25095 [Flectobacillus sp. BAB-3569]|nr:hypothetical protein BWI92_25095 [Flectobacillus sp. BAB-3569]